MYSIEKFREELSILNYKIWDLAEIRFKEIESAKLIVNFLIERGFRVEEGVGNLPTAFRAVYGSGSPVIGLLAEYDALDGLSQREGCFEKQPRTETAHGHGCGHNLLGTGVVGAALGLKEYVDKYPGKGTIVVLGCPAEEGGSGKTYMAREGVFDDLDIALTWHPCTMNASMGCSNLANIQAYFRFHGISSHAANAPEKGRSSLDAVELMSVGTNFLREHMEMTDRVHYAVIDTGGTAPNVVQSYAEVLYLVRSRNNKTVQDLYDRVCDIAKGAALMTETKLEIEFDKACSNVIQNTVLGELVHEVMVNLGPPTYTKEEKKYVRKFHEIVGEEARLSDDGAVPHYDMELRKELIATHPMGDFILPFKAVDTIQNGSSDMGDVSHIAPLVQFQTACFTQGTPGHSWMWVAQGTSEFAIKGMIFAGQIMADTAIKLMNNRELVLRAKEEHKRRIGNRPYSCPIPADIKPAVYR